MTGYMVECGGVFVECLEGPPENVKSTMKVIESDRRHHNIATLLHHRTSHRRAFGVWSMNVMFLDDQLLWQRAIGSVHAYDRFLEYSRDPAFSIGVLARAYRHACAVLRVDPAAPTASRGKIPRLKQMLRD
ncbi:hypothetical protein TSO352_20825 [Azospirillum sp. TSO35-2]|nr:hypothetical protein TSO352_20825 [Azospirillum sp. TSO35-2]